jgi:hypothetical protein
VSPASDATVAAGPTSRRSRASGKRWDRLAARSGATTLAATVVLCATVAAVTATGAAAASCPNEALRAGLSTGLPDCRAYEQVSPAEKDGQEATPQGSPRPVQAAPDGSALAYTNFGAFTGSSGSTALLDGHLSARGPSGWQTTELTPAKRAGSTSIVGYFAGYDFSEDLSRTILKAPLPLPGTTATTGVMNLFLRGFDGTYTWINAQKPPVLPQEGCPECVLSEDEVAYAGAARDFSRILFQANASLAGGAPEAPGVESLYESTGGNLWYVGVLPDGTNAAGSSEAGGGISTFYSSFAPSAAKRVEHAISEDGSRIVFQAAADGGEPDPAQGGQTEVYDRIGATETIELSAPATGATPKVTTSEPARFWAASSNGSRVFFTTSAELTTPSNTGTSNNSEDLYEYNLDSRTLNDLTVDSNPADAANGAGVLGVVGTANDGSEVYFVATGQLVAGHGVDGEPNLYAVHDGGNPIFIATLNPEDERDWSATPAQQKAYVTPDGRHLAFMSINSPATLNFPTGYDNTDQNTGSPDSEVYEYSAPSSSEEAVGRSGTLVCGSCDPSGARPLGNAYIGATSFSNVSTPFHQPRSLNEDGTRMFFSAPDRLASDSGVVGAQSPHVKVYEYESGGEGTCAAERGCVYLISSASNPADDVFLDADARGENVFFATLNHLSSTDGDNLLDIYDARVGGGIAASTVEANCISGCRGAVPASSEAPPLPSGFAGASGNLAPPPAGPATKPKKLSCRAKALKVRNPKARRRALKRCARRPHKVSRRAAR